MLLILIRFHFEREKIEELKFVQKQRERTHGVDVYSLAIGSGSTDTSAVNKFVDVIESSLILYYI